MLILREVCEKVGHLCWFFLGKDEELVLQARHEVIRQFFNDRRLHFLSLLAILLYENVFNVLAKLRQLFNLDKEE